MLGRHNCDAHIMATNNERDSSFMQLKHANQPFAEVSLPNNLTAQTTKSKTLGDRPLAPASNSRPSNSPQAP